MKCCDINSGKLRHKVLIEREGSTPDGAGGTALIWATHATIRCFVKPISGSERLQAQRLEANITHRIFTRYRTDLLTSDRINFNGRLMQITAIINLEEENKHLEIYASEGEAT